MARVVAAPAHPWPEGCTGVASLSPPALQLLAFRTPMKPMKAHGVHLPGPQSETQPAGSQTRGARAGRSAGEAEGASPTAGEETNMEVHRKLAVAKPRTKVAKRQAAQAQVKKKA